MNRLLSTIAVTVLTLVSTMVWAELRPIPDEIAPKLIGRVYLDSDRLVISPRVRKQIDLLVPSIKQHAGTGMIRIEGSYHRSARSSTNIGLSFKIAREFERYLREQHQFESSLCIASGDGGRIADHRSSVAIYLYPGVFTETKISP